MQDTIKVFVGIPVIDGYVQSEPPPNFNVQFVFTATITYYVVKNDTIIQEGTGWQWNAVIGDSPGVIYSALYTEILSHCAALEYPAPGQDDIFCYIPTALSQIFINVPSLA